MITAEKAKELMYNHHSQRSKIIDDISASIENAATNGLTEVEVSVPPSLYDKLVEEVKVTGFTIHNCDTKDKLFINWEDLPF